MARDEYDKAAVAAVAATQQQQAEAARARADAVRSKAVEVGAETSAEEVFREAEERFAGAAGAFEARGFQAAHDGWEAAVAVYERAVAAAEQSAAARARCEAARAAYETAAATLDMDLIRRFGGEPSSSLHQIAHEQVRRGLTAAAMATHRLALRFYPSNYADPEPGYLLSLAGAFVQGKREDTARQCLDQALTRADGHTCVLIADARKELGLGDPVAALRTGLQRFGRYSHEAGNVHDLAYLAGGFAKYGLLDEGNRIFADVLQGAGELRTHYAYSLLGPAVWLNRHREIIPMLREQFAEHPESFYSTVLSALTTSGHLDEAMSWLDQWPAGTGDAVHRESAAHTLLEALVKSERFGDAFSLLPVLASSQTYRALVGIQMSPICKGLVAAGRKQFLLNHIDGMEPGALRAAFLTQFASMADHPEFPAKVLAGLDAEAFQTLEKSWNGMVHAFAEDGNIQAAQRILDLVRDKGIDVVDTFIAVTLSGALADTEGLRLDGRDFGTWYREVATEEKRVLALRTAISYATPITAAGI